MEQQILTTFSAILFGVSAGFAQCTTPTVTSNPPDRAVCAGNNTTFHLTATGATSYRWQVNTGTGFTDLADNTTYSGVTTNTLTITGATATMNTYLYRAVVINGAASCFSVSGSGILTVSNMTLTAASQTNVSCFGGSNGTISAVASGGAAPYSYSWSPSGGTGATISGRPAGMYTLAATDNIGCAASASFTITQPAAPVSGSTLSTPVSCFDGANGSIDLTPSGGTPGYTFSWGGTITTEDPTGLAAGMYTVTITDANGCIGTTGAIITQPPAIDGPAILSQVNNACFGGTGGAATVSPATGGTGAFTYDWAPGNPTGDGTTSVTALANGTWTVTATDANGCTTSQSFTITAAQDVSISAEQTNPSCNGAATGSIEAMASGANGPFTYSWWPSGENTATAANLAAGTHIVTVTDLNGCTSTAYYTLVDPAAITASTIVTNVSCHNGTDGGVSVVPAGGTGTYTYLWSPSGSIASSLPYLSAGSGSVTVTDGNGCTTTQSFTVTQPTAVAISTTQTAVSCNGLANGTASILATGGSGSYTYDWYPFVSTSANASGLSAGIYTVTVTDGDGCTGTTELIVTQPPAIAGPAILSQVNNACFGGTGGAATVSPATGGTGAFTYDWAPGSPTGDGTTSVTALANGTWTVTATDANGCTASQSFAITSPQPISISAEQTNPSCNGAATGSIEAVVSGGNGPFTYAWSPSGENTATAANLAAGIHTVTVTGLSGCTSTAYYTLVDPAAFTASTIVTNVSCHNGTDGGVSVVPAGGTGTYTYLWSPSGSIDSSIWNLSAGSGSVTVTDGNGCTTTQSFTVTQPTAIAISTTQTAVSCNGLSDGTASILATGGTGFYTYNWYPFVSTSANASGLSAGIYTVTVTDSNGCTGTTGAIITQPPAIEGPAILSQVNNACFGGAGGAATVSPATGGTGAFTYDWAPGNPTGDGTTSVTALANGTWTVTATDANGCTASQSFGITSPQPISISAEQTNPSCNGTATGSIEAVVSGGNGPFTYAWSPSGENTATAANLAAGIHTVTVTDLSGCTSTASFTLVDPAAVTASTIVTNVSCHNGTDGGVSVVPAGGTGTYTYLWSPFGSIDSSIWNLSAGSGSVTVTDGNGCTTTQSFTVTQPTAVVISTTQTAVSCNGLADGTAGILATGGTGSYTYDWYPFVSTSANAAGLSGGMYMVMVTDGNGCGAMMEITIAEPAALTANTTIGAITCNGSNDGTAGITVTGGTGAYSYTWSPPVGSGSTIAGLQPGSYTVTATDANGCAISQTFTLTEPAALAADAVATPIVCNGHSSAITVNASGGTLSYTGTGTFVSAAGSFTYTVTDAHGCEATTSVTITEPAPLVLTGSAAMISCNGENDGHASVLATGGAGAYTYIWTPSSVGSDTVAANLTAGTYVCVVQDGNGCRDTIDFLVSQPAAITTLHNAVLCPGQTITVGANTYIAAGTYTDILTSQDGCDSTVTTIVTNVPSINTSTTMNNMTIVAAAAGAGYQWIDCATNATITGATSQSFTPVTNGSYAVILTDGCSDTSACVAITTLGLNTLSAVRNTTLYPNPSNGAVTIDWGISLDAAAIEITDITGKAVYAITAENTFSHQVSLHQPAGIYYVRVSNGGEQVILKMVVN